MFDPIARVIQLLEENKEVLAGKFQKGKRLHLIADLLGPDFHPPRFKKGEAPGGDEARKWSEFYKILEEFDRKYEFAPAVPERFTKIYNAYLSHLKEIQKEPAPTGKP